LSLDPLGTEPTQTIPLSASPEATVSSRQVITRPAPHAERSRPDATVALVATTASQLIAPFMMEYHANLELARRQATESRDQAELIGRLSSDLDHARETIGELSAEGDGAGWSRFIPMELLLGVIVLAAIVIMAGWGRWLIH